MSAAPPIPCPWCGARCAVVHVHGHGQCAACGNNVEPCCAGDSPNDAATTLPVDGHPEGAGPRLFPQLFAQLGGERATVTTEALLFALSQHLDCDYDEARLVLEAAERVGLLATPAPGVHRLRAPAPAPAVDRSDSGA